jgi:hypothetical protein
MAQLHDGDFIYYADQSDWQAEDFNALFSYFNRLGQYMGPAEIPARYRGRAAAQARAIARKRSGARDEEIAAMDLSRMSVTTRYLLKHVLIFQRRLVHALQTYPNLRGLETTETPQLPIVLSEDPQFTWGYFTKAGIHL